jgi:molybdenum cofactor cytidylyltransferase
MKLPREDVGIQEPRNQALHFNHQNSSIKNPPSLTFSPVSAIFRTMYRSPSFGGVILAAGDSSRMGRDKALLPWPPGESQTIRKDTFLSAAIRSLSLSADFVLVVAGKNEPDLAAIAYANAATVVRNSDPSRGQFSSLQIGLQEVLNRGRDAAIITLVDRPPAPANVVQMLRDRFEAAPQNIWAVVPEFEGRHGHPFVAGREMMERFLREPVSGNARDVEHRHQEHIAYVTVSEPFVTLNINTPEDYARLAQPS